MSKSIKKLSAATAGLLILALSGPTPRFAAANEPYLSVRTGLRCSQCHVNRSGGGGRNDFGSVYAQTQLSMRQYPFQGRSINSFLAVGADLRVTAEATSDAAQPNSAVRVDEANLYLEARVVPDVLTVYLDQTVGPTSASTREVFGLLDLPAEGWLKGGKFLVPFGLRLPDDEAFIRQRTGFTYSTPDLGFEVGMQPGPLSVIASLTNGTTGGSENDDGKQIAGTATLIFRSFRIGASAAHNDASTATRSALGSFAGVNLGRFTLLGEVDYISDSFDAEPDLEQFAAYVEGNFLVIRGLNVRASYGFLDPDRDIGENARTRLRFGVELFPIPFLRVAATYTVLQDIPQATTDSNRFAIQLHGFF